MEKIIISSTECKIIISNIELFLNDVGQIINMGGPWVGTLSINGRVISDNCFIDCFVFDEISNTIFFVKYHTTSNWRDGAYFTINFCGIDETDVFEYTKRFDMLFINKLISPIELEIFHAFHNNDHSKISVFNLGTEPYN